MKKELGDRELESHVEKEGDERQRCETLTQVDTKSREQRDYMRRAGAILVKVGESSRT